MEPEYTICVECDDLQASLAEKDKEIQRLKLHIKNLTNFLLWSKKKYEKNSVVPHKSSHHNDENKYSYQTEGPENDISSSDLINLSCDMLNMSRHYCLKSKSVQTDIIENKSFAVAGASCQTDFESENVDDYVYDYNYQMYYSASTGYYYDDKTGLTYDPQTCTYYKYNYDEKVYEMFPQQESVISSEVNNYMNDAVLDKVNSLNLNDESLNGEESTLKIQSVVSNISEKSMDGNEISEINNAEDSAGLTRDWQITDGTMLSVKDMVKQVVDEYNNVSDYTYDETYQMYYSQSTGFYYDSVRKLLYDPYSGTYYSFDEDTQKYEFHSKVDPNLPNVKNIKVLKCAKMKARKGFKNFAKKNKVLNSNKISVNKVLNSNKINVNKVLNSSKVNVEVPISCAVVPRTSENEDSSLSTDCVNADTSNPIDLNSPDKEESSANKDPVNSERLKIREKYWKKKLEHTDQSSTSPLLNDPIYDEISDDEEIDGDFSSPEEGEVFSSEGESEAPVSIVRSPVLGTNQKSDSIPPSIRAIVENSEKLKIGSLILITYSGGVIGRNKNNAIYIPDTSISKLHAQIKFSAEDQTYSIKDLGSQNGTFVNDKRLSEPKVKSESCALNHGDKLSLGFFKVLLHIHDGNETCDNCEPGQVIAEISSKSAKILVHMTKEDREQQRREELKRLKKKYGLQGAIFERKIQLHLKAGTTEGYEDKAEMRRQTVGSDNPYEKTQVASVDSVMPENNKGYQMLKKMGWKEGQSLGAAADSGLTEPIPFRPWTTKAGLGSCDLPFSTAVADVPEDKRSKRWIKAQERYFQLSLEPPTS